jgi:hypothetical protein
VWFAQLKPGPHSGSVTIEITIRDRTPPPITLGWIEHTFPIEINMPPKKSTQ